MTLEKKRMLRKIEFTLTDDMVHPECHCEYHDIILEDGVEIARSRHREVEKHADVMKKLQSAELYR